MDRPPDRSQAGKAELRSERPVPVYQKVLGGTTGQAGGEEWWFPRVDIAFIATKKEVRRWFSQTDRLESVSACNVWSWTGHRTIFLESRHHVKKDFALSLWPYPRSKARQAIPFSSRSFSVWSQVSFFRASPSHPHDIIWSPLQRSTNLHTNSTKAFHCNLTFLLPFSAIKKSRAPPTGVV